MKAYGRLRCPRKATATDAKLGVSFHTSLYTNIKIHSSYEKHALHEGMHYTYVAIVCFEYTVDTVRREKLVKKLAMKET